MTHLAAQPTQTIARICADGISAPAKINLSLKIIGQRADGMHLIDSIMTLLDLADTIKITVRPDGELRREWKHPQIKEDLCLRAAAALRQATDTKIGATIAVEKRIPVGGGLGGASSDAAATLLALNALWQTKLSRAQLRHLAAQLGADVPFFLYGRPARARGIGEQLSPARVPLRHYLLVFAGMAETKKVFAEYRRRADQADFSTPSMIAPSNDLAAAAVAICPPIAKAAHCLQAAAGEAKLSGSGATVFAAFSSRQQAQAAQKKLPPKTISIIATGIARHSMVESDIWGVAKW